ncbi:MAG: pitrilysin family protein, partial [Ignavibacteria bacterium]
YFNKFLFGHNPYGNPIYGSRKTIEALTSEDLKEFFDVYYDYSQAGIAVVGDFTSDKMKQRISSLFLSTPMRDKNNLMKDRKEDLLHFSNSRVLLVDKDDSRETTFLIGGTGVSWSNKEFTQIDVINTILGGRFTSWLNDELRVNAGLTYGAGSKFRGYKYSGTFYVSSFTATETTIDAIDLALEVLNRLHTKGIDEETLLSAKNYVKGQFPLDYETSGDLAGLLTSMHFYGLDDSFINDFEKNVNGMTVEIAKDIVSKYFPKENLQFVLIGKADEIRDKVKKYGELTEKNIDDDGY